MGKRARARGKADKLHAPTSEYASESAKLVLRGALTPKTRTQYAAVLAGEGRPAATQEDAWQRAVEFLFERLAVSWEIGGVHYTESKELLQRLRAATQDERRFVRDTLREHCAEWFPDIQAP